MVFAQRIKELDNDYLHHKAPSIFAATPWHGASDRYKFIPTIDAVNALRDNGFMPVEANQSNTRIPGKGTFAKHMIKFIHQDHTHVSNVGDEIPQVVLINSHDGTTPYQMMMGLLRLACSNGLLVNSSTINKISVRHKGQEDLLAQVIEGSYEIIGDIPVIAKQVSAFKAIELSKGEQVAFAGAALMLKNEEMAGIIEPESILNIRRFEDKEATLWNTYNIIQENLMKGGAKGKAMNGRNTSLRPIRSVDGDTKLNKALWALTENMAKLKTPELIAA